MIEAIQQYLQEENDCASWQEFVDRQQCGDCQSIAGAIADRFPQFMAVFGEVEVEPYLDEEGKEQTLMTHHWVALGDTLYDFSKGTLRGHLREEDNPYDPEVSDPTRYHPIRVRMVS